MAGALSVSRVVTCVNRLALPASLLSCSWGLIRRCVLGRLVGVPLPEGRGADAHGHNRGDRGQSALARNVSHILLLMGLARTASCRLRSLFRSPPMWDVARSTRSRRRTRVRHLCPPRVFPAKAAENYGSRRPLGSRVQILRLLAGGPIESKSGCCTQGVGVGRSSAWKLPSPGRGHRRRRTRRCGRTGLPGKAPASAGLSSASMPVAQCRSLEGVEPAWELRSIPSGAR